MTKSKKKSNQSLQKRLLKLKFNDFVMNIILILYFRNLTGLRRILIVLDFAYELFLDHASKNNLANRAVLNNAVVVQSIDNFKNFIKVCS